MGVALDSEQVITIYSLGTLTRPQISIGQIFKAKIPYISIQEMAYHIMKVFLFSQTTYLLFKVDVHLR